MEQMNIEELRAYFLQAAQDHLDVISHEKGFDSALTCISYINSKNLDRRVYAALMNDYRDTIWDYCEKVFDDVMAGRRTIPASAEEFIAELPKLNWQEV